MELRGLRTSCEDLTPDVIAAHVDAGYHLVLVEDVMRHDLIAVNDAAVPPGLSLAPWEQAHIPNFYAAHCSAFAERPGFPNWPMAQWVSWTAGEQTFRPDLSYVALADDAGPIAFITCDDASGEEDASAYIIQVGVHPKWRRMGIGRSLVTIALTAWRREGRAGVLCHVNVDNVASARMLEGTGFRKVRQRGVFERPAP